MNTFKKNCKSLARLKKRRKLWLKIHLYLGLFTGSIFLVIGLTGSILTFWLEIDRWLNPELMLVDVPPHALTRPLEEIIDAATAEMPNHAEFKSVYAPHHYEDASYLIYHVPMDEAGNKHVMNVFVNPYTAEVIGSRIFYHATDLFSHCFIGFIFKLHYSLLAGKIGMIVVGFFGFCFLILTLSGLILWWPLTGKWIKALTIKQKTSAKRLNHDLHKTFGFYSSLVLFVVLLSGISMNLPDQFIWLVERFSPVTAVEQYKTIPDSDKSIVTVNQAWKIAEALYPDGYLYWFSVPKGDTDIYVFTIHAPLRNGFYGRSKVLMDSYGEVLNVFDPLSGTGGDVFMQWMWPLHSGYLLGMTGRIFVLLSGVACSVLFFTGVIRWLQKRQAAQKKRNLVR